MVCPYLFFSRARELDMSPRYDKYCARCGRFVGWVVMVGTLVLLSLKNVCLFLCFLGLTRLFLFFSSFF
jgi:hypothetical protein